MGFELTPDRLEFRRYTHCTHILFSSYLVKCTNVSIWTLYERYKSWDRINVHIGSKFALNCMALWEWNQNECPQTKCFLAHVSMRGDIYKSFYLNRETERPCFKFINFHFFSGYSFVVIVDVIPYLGQTHAYISKDLF